MEYKSFFTNRGIIANDSITLEENGVLKNDPKERVEVFNNFYVYTLETTSGKRPYSIDNPYSPSQDRATVTKIVESYKNHPSVVKIKGNILTCSLSFDLPPACKKEI